MGKTTFIHISIIALITSSLLVITSNSGGIDQSSIEEPYYLPIRGADISFLPQIEDNIGKYYFNSVEKDLLIGLKSYNFNSIRLRIWNDPIDGYCNKEKTLVLAKRVSDLDFQFLLDFHYSDSWADPGQQNKPEKWVNFSFNELRSAVYNFTKDIMTSLKNQGSLPDIVQIGNEIICGMLWNDGRICGEYNTDIQWDKFTDLLKAGIKAVQEVGDEVKIMIHIDRGGDKTASVWFYDKMIEKNVSFDIIGLSYYPWWHGDFSDLKGNLDNISSRYEQDICIVETAYPWTLDWYDSSHNLVGLEKQLLEGYPATIQGQKSFLNDLFRIIQNSTHSKGIGVYYWEPEWISTPSFGSSWENVALFDFQGNSIASMEVFDQEPSLTNSSTTDTVSVTNESTSNETSNKGLEIILIALFTLVRKKKNTNC